MALTTKNNSNIIKTVFKFKEKIWRPKNCPRSKTKLLKKNSNIKSHCYLI